MARFQLNLSLQRVFSSLGDFLSLQNLFDPRFEFLQCKLTPIRH